MADLLDLARQFRLALLRRDIDAETVLIRAYSGIGQAIERRMRILADKMIQAAERGETLNQSWLYEADRLQSLKRDLERELAVYDELASRVIMAGQVDALRAAQIQAVEAITAALPSVSVALNRLPIAAIQSLVGRLSDGSPVREYLERYAKAYADHAAAILRDGLAMGRNPRVVARELVKTAGMPRNRAIAIARDTMLASYRDATLDTYRENADVVHGWIWLSALPGGRPCAACVGMHGTFHSLDELFASHSRCRCTTIPALEPRSTIQTGSAWLRAQPAWAQREVFGSDAAYRAYSAGVVKLEDFVGKTSDPRWGPRRYQKSLKQVLGAKQAQEFYARPN